MMESVLKKIFENQELRENFSQKPPDYLKMHQQVSQQLETWKAKLSPEDYEKLEKLLTMQAEAESLQCLEDFRYGFKLGTLICFELLELDKNHSGLIPPLL